MGKSQADEQETEKKIPVQFRIGAQLLERVDADVDRKWQSRNAWMAEAVEDLLEGGEPLPLHVTASELLADKYTLMVRLDPLLVEMVDELCGERGVPRTVWLLDACMTRLRRNGKGKRRR